MARKILISLLLVVGLLAACAPEGSLPTATVIETNPPPGAEPPATQPPATEPPATEPPGIPALPPEPQEVTFRASDGQELHGLYYPAAVNPAPLVVLMHWVGGNMSDWYEIAVWLQNRGQANPFPNPSGEPWWDPTWFPPVTEGASYGVFIFSFRGCAPYDAGCAGWTPDVWLLDAQAAMLKSVELEGIDPTQIVTIGSSIGADGAADGCLYLNEQIPGSCRGAAPLTPGDYLTLPFDEVVKDLGEEQPPVPVWCLTTPEEVGFCSRLTEQNLTVIEHQNGRHGNFILVPETEPLGLQSILDFLAATVGP